MSMSTVALYNMSYQKLIDIDWKHAVVLLINDKVAPCTEEEYLERIKWLKTPEICRKDIDSFINGNNIERKYSARCKKILQ